MSSTKAVKKPVLELLRTPYASAKHRLSFFCAQVKNLERSYEDVAEQIEDAAYEECENGNIENAVEELKSLAFFYEKIENKNEEISRDLADIYLLIGQMYQYTDRFGESVNWLSKAATVDDGYPVPFHSLSISFMKMNDTVNAAKCLEQEIVIAPGNYYSYLILADLYRKSKLYNKEENCLKNLLSRDPENVQALHRLILYYEKCCPSSDVELLRRRLLNVGQRSNMLDAVIKTYHLCRENRLDEALEFLETWHRQSPDLTIVYLLKAHIHGELRHFTRKRRELAAFREKNGGREDVMLAKLEEFGSIFGKNAEGRLKRRLILSPQILIS